MGDDIHAVVRHAIGFWHEQSQGYLARLQKDKLEVGRLDDLKPLWDLIYSEQLAQAEAAVKAAKEAEAKQTDKNKKQAALERRKESFLDCVLGLGYLAQTHEGILKEVITIQLHPLFWV